MEYYPCSNLAELWKKERDYILENINNVINKIIPILNDSERTERKNII